VHITEASTQVELFHDDGGPFATSTPPLDSTGTQWGVNFSLPKGWGCADIVEVKLYVGDFVSPLLPYEESNPLEIHIYDIDGYTDLITPFTVTPSTPDDWLNITISSPVSVSGDFTVAIEFLHILHEGARYAGPWIAIDYVRWGNVKWTYKRSSESDTWTKWSDHEAVIRAVVHTCGAEASFASVWTTDLSNTPKVKFDKDETMRINWIADGTVHITLKFQDNSIDACWYSQPKQGHIDYLPSKGSGMYSIHCTGAKETMIAYGTLFIVPEIPFGTALALVASFIALAASKLKGSLKKN